MPLIYSYDSSTQSYSVIEGSTATGAVIVPSSYDDGINGVADVKKIGVRAFSQLTGVTSVTLPNTITVIDNLAFNGCTSLEAITIPNSVLYINNAAFQYCSSLLSVNFEQNSNLIFLGAYAFLHCQKLKTINLNINGLIHLQPHTFWYCHELENITLPSNLETIGVWAFEYCYKLKNIILPNSLRSIGQKAFAATGLISIVIPDGVTAIGPEAFAYNYDLVSANIPSSIRNPGLGSGIFKNCVKLASTIVFPEGITEIPGNILEGCANVTNIILPSTLLKIGAGNNAFSGTGIVSITIPPSVTIIGDWAFAFCRDLTTINLENVTTLGYGVFSRCRNLNNVILNDQIQGIRYLFEDCTSLTNITIPKSCTRIEPYSFSGCTSLSSVVIPSDGNLRSIENLAFEGCSNLSLINLPEGVQELGILAFGNCLALTSISIPSTVNIIADNAFYNSGLSSIQVSFNNSNFSSLDGVLYNKDKTILIAYPKNKVANSFSIPAGVNIIGTNAFYNALNLLDIILPSGLNEIKPSAFLSCINLSKVFIPASVLNIGDRALGGITKLQDVTFLGGPPPIPQNTNPFTASPNITVYYYSKNSFSEAWSQYGDSYGQRPLRVKYSDLNILEIKDNFLDSHKVRSNLSKVASRKKQLSELIGETKSNIINRIKKKSDDDKKNEVIKNITKLSIEQIVKKDKKINDFQFAPTNWVYTSFNSVLDKVSLNSIELPKNAVMYTGSYTILNNTTEGGLTTTSVNPPIPLIVIAFHERNIFFISPMAKWLFSSQNEIPNSIGVAPGNENLVSIANSWSNAQKETWNLRSADFLGVWKIFDAQNNKLYINYNVKSLFLPSTSANSLAEFIPVEGWVQPNLRKDRVDFSFQRYFLQVNLLSSPGYITTIDPVYNLQGLYSPLLDTGASSPVYAHGGPVFTREDPLNDNIYYIKRNINGKWQLSSEVIPTDPSLGLGAVIQILFESNEYASSLFPENLTWNLIASSSELSNKTLLINKSLRNITFNGPGGSGGYGSGWGIGTSLI